MTSTTIADEMESMFRLMRVRAMSPDEEARLADLTARKDEADRVARIRTGLAKAGWDRRPIDLAMSDAFDESAANAYLHALRSIDDRSGGVVVLAGAPGSGKTAAAARWAIGRRPVPRFIRAAEFFRTSRYDGERDETLGACALVFDDAGAEYADPSGSFRVDFDELIDRFYADKRALVITTNMDAKTFADRYGARVSDRLRECGRWVGSSAASMRRRPM